MNDVGTAGTDVASSCANDWINIPCATNSLRQDQQSFTSANSEGPNTCVDRICGMVFNSVTQLDITAAIVKPVNSEYTRLITHQNFSQYFLQNSYFYLIQ